MIKDIIINVVFIANLKTMSSTPNVMIFFGYFIILFFQSPSRVHVNQHMKVPPPPPPDPKQAKPLPTATTMTITPLGQARKGDTKTTGSNNHQRSKTLPIIPLTSAMTAITPKQAVPLGRASAPTIPPQNKVEAVNYGSPAAPELISRIKPVPPKSAPPVVGVVRRRKVEDASSVKSTEEPKKKMDEDDEEEEEEEEEEDDDASDAEKEETSIKDTER